MAQQPDITLFFLGASRAIRIAWLLEELELPYKLIASQRLPNNLAPPEFKAKIPAALGKSPTLQDGDLVVQESAAISEYSNTPSPQNPFALHNSPPPPLLSRNLITTIDSRYLCETYDTGHRLIPQAVAARAKVREFMAAAEGTFLIHALAVLYTRLQIPEPARTDGTLDKLEAGLSKNVHNDLDWLDSELEGTGGKYLVGTGLTAADIMVAFSVEFIFARALGVKGQEGRWGNVRNWLAALQREGGYRKAVQRTGFKL